MRDDHTSETDSESLPEQSQYRAQQKEISVDEISRLLASARRRRLLSYLTTRPGESVSKDKLVDIIAEREQPDPGPATHRSRIITDLHHVHLPKLADAGLIDYDPVAETVQYNQSEKLESLLAASNAIEEKTE